MNLAERYKKILNFIRHALGRRVWNVFSKNLHKGLWYWKSCNYSLKPTHENPYSQYKRSISSAQTLSTPFLSTELQSTNVFIIHGLTKTRGPGSRGGIDDTGYLFNYDYLGYNASPAVATCWQRGRQRPHFVHKLHSISPAKRFCVCLCVCAVSEISVTAANKRESTSWKTREFQLWEMFPGLTKHKICS
jgi:hypothetical protein